MMVSQLSLSACRTSFLGAYSDMSIGLHKVSILNEDSSSTNTEFETNLCFSNRFNLRLLIYSSQVETGQLLFRLEPPKPSVEPVKGWSPFTIGWLDQTHVWLAW